MKKYSTTTPDNYYFFQILFIRMAFCVRFKATRFSTSTENWWKLKKIRTLRCILLMTVWWSLKDSIYFIWFVCQESISDWFNWNQLKHFIHSIVHSICPISIDPINVVIYFAFAWQHIYGWLYIRHSIYLLLFWQMRQCEEERRKKNVPNRMFD